MGRDRTVMVTLILVLAVVLVAGTATRALAAGCFSTYDGCSDCARRMLRRSMIRLDLAGIRRANVYLWDCVIELYHCVLLGSHDRMACPV